MLPQLRGAFCFVFMDEHTLYAARDPHGIRPAGPRPPRARLGGGQRDRGPRHRRRQPSIREVEPGELIAIDADGLRSQRFAEPEPKGCVFEYVYLARPDTTIDGRGRARGPGRDGPPAGRASTRSRPTWSSPTPESGTPAAIGYAQESGIPYGQGLVKNSYVGRTFIQPSQTIRQLGIRLKLNPLQATSSAASGWSSSTTRSCAATPSARWCGCCARPARPRCTCASPRPPVRWPCFYGIDFATRAELIATGLGVEEVRSSIGADTLGYISEDGMVEATGQPRDRLCTACFTGVYPIEPPERDRLGTSLLELPLQVNGEASGDASAPPPAAGGPGPRHALDVDGVSTGVAGGAADALTRP